MRFPKNDVNKILNGNTDILLKSIKTLFNTVTKLLKYTKKDYNMNNNLVEDKKNKENKLFLPNINMKKDNNINKNKKSNYNKVSSLDKKSVNIK